MNKLLLTAITVAIAVFTTSFGVKIAPLLSYDCSESIVSSVASENDPTKYYRMVKMDRSQNRYKAKYFAFKENGKSVYQRYMEWKEGKNVVLLSSGTYIDRYTPVPDGLTIDNGRIVNRNISNKFDGLVIVYATGGIAVTNVKEQNINIKCNNVDKSYNVNDYLDREEFIGCAQSVEATIFQTHLLVYKNELKISPPRYGSTASNEAERRFLAACYKNGKLYHIILHIEPKLTLYDATVAANRFLKELKEMDNVTYMINLDTGMQNVFQLLDCRGNVQNDIVGTIAPAQATNLLVYYYE